MLATVNYLEDPVTTNHLTYRIVSAGYWSSIRTPIDQAARAEVGRLMWTPNTASLLSLEILCPNSTTFSKPGYVGYTIRLQANE